MADHIDKSIFNEDLESERMNVNDNCERDMRVVTDGETLEDGIVELTDKKEYIDEP